MTSPGRPLGVAVVGYSFMGRTHSHAWRNLGSFYPDLPATERRVLVGRDPVSVDHAARQLGWAETATDWRSVIERPDIDIVDICTPGDLHAEIAEAALAAGKHVLVEKPVANSVAQAESMVEVARSAAVRGVASMVGFNYRGLPALQMARQLIADGELGAIREMRASYLQDWLRDAAAPMTWRLRKEQAGSGVLGDLGSHVVDQVHYLLGDSLTSVSGHLRTFVAERPGADGPEPVTVDDAAWMIGDTASGATVSMEVSRMATGRKNGLGLELFGTEGSVAFHLERPNELWVHTETGAATTRGARRVLVTEPDHPELAHFWPPGHVLGWDATFIIQAAHFVHAISTGTPPSPSFADGLAVQRVLASVEASSAQGGVRTAPHDLAAPALQH